MPFLRAVCGPGHYEMMTGRDDGGGGPRRRLPATIWHRHSELPKSQVSYEAVNVANNIRGVYKTHSFGSGLAGWVGVQPGV